MFPDIERELDWQTPAWDQVLQLIRAPELIRPQCRPKADMATSRPSGFLPSGQFEDRYVGPALFQSDIDFPDHTGTGCNSSKLK